MRNRIADLAGIAATPDNAELLGVEDVAHVLGVSQREALKLTQREDFPEPSMHRLHRRANERRAQPRPAWDRGDVERWAKEERLAQHEGGANGS